MTQRRKGAIMMMESRLERKRRIAMNPLGIISPAVTLRAPRPTSSFLIPSTKQLKHYQWELKTVLNVHGKVQILGRNH